MRYLFYAFLACLWLASASAASAAILVISSPDDLNNLTVGVPFTVNVELQGNTQTLSYLAAILTYSGPVADPVALTAGSIVPDPNSPAFFELLFPPTVDGSYAAALSIPPDLLISGNGVFFTFDLIPNATGPGLLEITFAAATSARTILDESNQEVVIYEDFGPVVGDPVSFNVVGEGNPAIPEPASATIFGLGSLCFAGLAWRRKSRENRR